LGEECVNYEVECVRPSGGRPKKTWSEVAAKDLDLTTKHEYC